MKTIPGGAGTESVLRQERGGKRLFLNDEEHVLSSSPCRERPSCESGREIASIILCPASQVKTLDDSEKKQATGKDYYY